MQMADIVSYLVILSDGRLGATTYNEVYGNVIKFPADAKAGQTLWLFSFVSLTPIVGIGCLMAFIKGTYPCMGPSDPKAAFGMGVLPCQIPRLATAKADYSRDRAF